MILYKKQIQVKQSRSGEWIITTDYDDRYITNVYTNITAWWQTQYESELRLWQKDLCVYDMINIFGPLEMFTIYKKGQGYNQTHDICLVRNVEHNVWALSTQRDFWVQHSDQLNVIFNVESSLGSVVDRETRDIWTGVLYELQKEYNPQNICKAVGEYRKK